MTQGRQGVPRGPGIWADSVPRHASAATPGPWHRQLPCRTPRAPHCTDSPKAAPMQEEMQAAASDDAEMTMTSHTAVVVQDQMGRRLVFKVGRRVPLARLMSVYCEKMGLEQNSIRFFLDGERIEPGDTAEKLAMRDQELIDAAMEQ